ncbi:hypothetical protein, partial [Escherichia coli]|uniref:hypothetical protein n=1 Tax=Escherichia coli TaxID=562 RepID=UPI002FBD681F
NQEVAISVVLDLRKSTSHGLSMERNSIFVRTATVKWRDATAIGALRIDLVNHFISNKKPT